MSAHPSETEVMPRDSRYCLIDTLRDVLEHSFRSAATSTQHTAQIEA